MNFIPFRLWYTDCSIFFCLAELLAPQLSTDTKEGFSDETLYSFGFASTGHCFDRL